MPISCLSVLHMPRFDMTAAGTQASLPWSLISSPTSVAVRPEQGMELVMSASQPPGMSVRVWQACSVHCAKHEDCLFKRQNAAPQCFSKYTCHLRSELLSCRDRAEHAGGSHCLPVGVASMDAAR